MSRYGINIRFSSLWVVVGGRGGARASNVGSGADESVEDTEADLERDVEVTVMTLRPYSGSHAAD